MLALSTRLAAASDMLDSQSRRPRILIPRTVKVLGWTSFFNDVGSEIIAPLLPQFVIGVLGGNRVHLGLIEGTAETLSSLVKLYSGRIADYTTRRKPFVLGGYACASILRPLMAFATAPWQVFLLRIGDRIGKGVRTAPRDAMIVDAVEPHQRGASFGFQRALDHLGAAVGTIIATLFLLLFPGSLRTLFFLTIIPGLFTIRIIMRHLAERRTELTALGPLPPLDSLKPQLRIFLASVFLFALANSSDAFLLVRASETGIATAALPLLWLFFHLAKSGGNLYFGKLLDRSDPRLFLLLGWVLYAGVYLLFASATRPWHIWLLFAAYSVFYSLTEPAEKVITSLIAGRETRASAFGWFHLATSVAALPASLVFGVLYQAYGPGAAFSLSAVFALAAAAFYAACVGPIDRPLPVR